MKPLQAQGESPGYAEPFPLPPLTSLSVDSSKKPPGKTCKYDGRRKVLA